MTTITLQPAQNPETLALPYPFHVSEDGSIQRQDFWRGSVVRVLGFQKDIDVQRVDLFWEDALEDLDKIVGMFVVTVDNHGQISGHTQPIGTVTVTEGALS